MVGDLKKVSMAKNNIKYNFNKNNKIKFLPIDEL